jgi:hypothetical protein
MHAIFFIEGWASRTRALVGAQDEKHKEGWREQKPPGGPVRNVAVLIVRKECRDEAADEHRERHEDDNGDGVHGGVSLVRQCPLGALSALDVGDGLWKHKLTAPA